MSALLDALTDDERNAIQALVDKRSAREPLTYEPAKPVSYFRDLTLAERGDNGALERLEQHGNEMRAELPRREAEHAARARAAGVEIRVNPNRTDGQGGYFSPPLWLMDQFAVAPRPARVLANRIPSLPLPSGASEVKVPRITTGNTVAVAADGAAVPSQDVVDAAASQPVTPLAGQSDVALQLLEQSPAGPHLDYVMFRDLTNSYDSQLEALLINGIGTGQTFAGILNLATGAGAVTNVAYTDASPTAAELVPFVAQAIAQLADKRNAPPEVLVMRTARWVWIAVAYNELLAAAERKLMTFVVDLADGIPATLGAGTQDAIIAIRATDSLLLEAPLRTEVQTEVLSGVMMARLQLHGYATAIHRQPTGIATVTGTGLAVQSGY